MAITFPTNPSDGDTYEGFIYNATYGVWNANGSGGGGSDSSVTTYATVDDLPLADNTTGDQAFVQATNRLYLWNGTGWYNIALINTAPEITSGGTGSYALENDGTATVITLQATDPEGLPINWSYSVTSGSLGTTATVSQADNVFTITPGTNNPADVGTFELTFTASDGVNIATNVNSFTLAFGENISAINIAGGLQRVDVGTQLYIPYPATWETYNSNLPSYLQGTVGTISINDGDSMSVTIDGSMRIWYLRSTVWNSGGISGATLYETVSGVMTGYLSDTFEIYYRDVGAGTYTLDNYSAMFFFTGQNGNKNAVKYLGNVL
jgi:hypothetical protein